MPRNFYISHGTREEKNLQEDLIIEAIKIYGHDVYYLPRKIVNRDTILNETIESKFGDAFKISMYIDTVDGFEGDGTLLTKFGLEIRDQIRFIVAKRQWDILVGRFKVTDSVEPAEGDLIYLPMVNGLFEIKFAEGDSPFYQLQNLPTFKLTCELFEYSNENIDVDIDGITDIRLDQGQRIRLSIGSKVSGDALEIGEDVRQTIDTGVYIEGVVAHLESDYSAVEVVQTRHSADGSQIWLPTDTGSGIERLVGQKSGGTYPITSIDRMEVLDDRDAIAQNNVFDTIGNDFVDFTETNPFGDITFTD